MIKTMKHVPAALVLAIIWVSTVTGQQPAATTTQNPADNYVTEKNFKSKVFEVKYRDVTNLAYVLKSLGSGFKGATVQSNAEFKTITVRDFPENIVTMEEAIKRLDAPAAPRPDIELQMYVLIASNTGSATADVPAGLKDVLMQLRGTLNYRNYELVASGVQRLTETSGVLQGSGIADVPSVNPGTPSMAMPYEYYLRNVSVVQIATGVPTVEISDFSFRTLDKDQARVQTALNLHDGEKVVVGTAALRNRALVIVLTAKLIK